MRILTALFASLLMLLLTGCIPERVVWSPDGTRAAVLGTDGLHLCDPDGTIGPLLIPEVSRAAWLPEGKRLLVTHPIRFNTWDEIMKADPEAAVSPKVVAAIKAALVAHAADPEKFNNAVENFGQDERTRALIFLRDTDKTLPAALFPTGVSSAPVAVDLPHLAYTPIICQIYDIAESAKAGAIILWGHENKMLEMRVSPSGKYVAVTLASYEKDTKELPFLFICPVAPRPGSDDVMGVDYSNVFPDWTPDGKSIVYFRPLGNNSEKDAQIGTLCRQTVLDDKGMLLYGKALPPRDDLAGSLFSSLFRVRCAADGRIFFTSLSVTLPATPNDFPPYPSLFMIQPGKQAIVSRVIPHSVEKSIGDAFQYFELSPDGQRISIPSVNGRVSVFTIATGEVLHAQPDSLYGNIDSTDLKSIPTWRSSHELTFVRLIRDGHPIHDEVIRYDITDPQHKTVVMSAHWDDTVSKDWLKEVPGTQPTTLPLSH